MNKNKILSGGEKNLTGGGKWGERGREVGGEGEGSGVKGGGKWGLGTPCPPPQSSETRVNKYVGKQIGSKCYVYEGLDGGGGSGIHYSFKL